MRGSCQQGCPAPPDCLDAVPEIPVLAAVEEDVGDGLSSRSAVAARAGDVWHFSGEEEVAEPNLSGAELYQQRALSLEQSLVELEYLLRGRWRVSVG